MIELVQISSNSFEICYKDMKLFRQTLEKPFLSIGKGTGSFVEKRGLFKKKETIHTKKAVTTWRIEQINEYEIHLYSELISLHLFHQSTKDQLKIHLECSDKSINRLWINIHAKQSEAIFGCGEQFSELNLRGKTFPIWSQEQGIGRGEPKWFSFILNLVTGGAGGSYYTTYYAQPTFISSSKYFCHVDTYNYAEFDFTKDKSHRLYLWGIPDQIILGKEDSLQNTVKNLVALLGKQPPLPDWVYSGIWLGIQGGVEVVKKKLKSTREAGLKVGAVWCQDWQGSRRTSFGKQLFWNWEHCVEKYKDLKEFIKNLHSQNIKFLAYINPFLVPEGPLYQIASNKGYLVKNTMEEDYHIYVTTFPAGLLDITNPNAVNWIKMIIKENLLDLGIDGWMADFGEYLPTDAILHSNEDAKNYHNRYPVDWAKINYEVLVETDNIGQLIFFTRAGSTNTSKYSTLVWAGDQMVNWTLSDGLASVIPAALSLGLQGIGYHHSDIGGYTSIFPYKRTKELFMRWAELSAFSMVMRTHEGNRPDDNWQYDGDIDCLSHLSRMTAIHCALKPYLIHISNEYQEKGLPTIRPLFLHYSDDPYLYSIKYEYLLGEDLLVAPVIRAKTSIKEIYLPNDTWIHFWTGDKYKGGNFTVKAPLGYPPVFYREQSIFAELFSELKSLKVSEEHY